MQAHFRNRDAALAFEDSKRERDKIQDVVGEFESQRSTVRNNK
jgi:hypothetical protein